MADEDYNDVDDLGLFSLPLSRFHIYSLFVLGFQKILSSSRRIRNRFRVNWIS